MHSTTNCSRVFIFIAQVPESLCSLMWRCAFICFVQADGVSSTLLLGSQSPLTFKRDRPKVLLKQADYWKTWHKEIETISWECFGGPFRPRIGGLHLQKSDYEWLWCMLCIAHSQDLEQPISHIPYSDLDTVAGNSLSVSNKHFVMPSLCHRYAIDACHFVYAQQKKPAHTEDAQG